MQAAKWMGLNPEKVWNLGLVAILMALFAARLLLVFTHLGLFGGIRSGCWG